MNYQELRKIAGTGDLILHAGNSLGAKILRVATASQYSHAALLVWADNREALYVAEMKPDTGYTLSPASDRLKEMAKSGIVRFGKMPYGIIQYKVAKSLSHYRDGSPDKTKDPAYSMPAAAIVWLAQWATPLIPKKYKFLASLAEKYAGTRLVCSTFVQKHWTEGGEKFDKPADPEDLGKKIEVLTMVTF